MVGPALPSPRLQLLAEGVFNEDVFFAHGDHRRLVERALHVHVAAFEMRPWTSIVEPDYQRRDVSPKLAATSRERGSAWSSIAAMNDSTVTGPTPRMAMKRRQVSRWQSHNDLKFMLRSC